MRSDRNKQHRSEIEAGMQREMQEVTRFKSKHFRNED